MTKEEILAIVAKNINVPGLVGDLLDKPLNDALDKMVADTSMPFDDIAKAALYPVLSKEVKKLVADQWAKLVSPTPAA